MVSLASGAMLARGMNADLVQVIRRGLYVLGIVILAFTTLDLLNVPLTAFAFVSGAIAIGVGFGAQNIINNFISGWILIWERPIRINDFIEIGDTTGTVEQINTRSTRIRRTDGVHLLVPNSQLLENTVVNWTLLDRMLRCVVRVGVAYGSDVDKVKEILEKMTKGREERKRKLSLIKAGRARRASVTPQPRIKQTSGESMSEESQVEAKEALESMSNPKVSIVVNDVK